MKFKAGIVNGCAIVGMPEITVHFNFESDIPRYW